MIRDDDTAVYGDKGYASDAKKRAAEVAGVFWGGAGEGQTCRQPAIAVVFDALGTLAGWGGGSHTRSITFGNSKD